MLSTIFQAFALLDAPLRRRWLVLVPLALIAAGLELIGTAGRKPRAAPQYCGSTAPASFVC